MNKSIRKTKKNLTKIFTLVVFFVILLLGMTFLSFKYLNDLRIEKEFFLNGIEGIEKGGVDFEKQVLFPEGGQIPKGGGAGKKRFINSLKRNIHSNGFINSIVLGEDRVILSNIKDSVDEDFLSEIANNDDYFYLEIEEGFLVKKKMKDTHTSIFFKKLRYDFSDYIYDIVVFILINILFSIVLYLIGRRFVNKAFLPVEENMKNMNDFVHNAGHEFKTPLSVIDSNIQLIKDTKKYNENMLDEVKNEGKKLNSLIDSLVRLIDIDGSKEKQELKVKPVIDSILSDFRDKISKKKLSLNVNVDEDIFVQADKNYLFILLSNIIGNAIKYNKENGIIDIIFQGRNLTIKDSGVGIASSDIEKIFDRFYKGDSSRNTEGFGIGLSLVKKISEIYNWRIKVESESGKGASFIISF